MSDLKSARKITKALQFLRYAYVFFQKDHGNEILCYAWDNVTRGTNQHVLSYFGIMT